MCINDTALGLSLISVALVSMGFLIIRYATRKKYELPPEIASKIEKKENEN